MERDLRKENKKFLDTLRVCDENGFSEIDLLRLGNLEIDLRVYCKEFLRLFDDRTNYKGCLVNLENILRNNTNHEKASVYLKDYLDYIKDLKLSISEKVTKIEKLDKLIASRYIWLSDSLHGLKIMIIVRGSIIINGQEHFLESGDDGRKSYKFWIDGEETDFGGIFIKDGHVDYMKVSTLGERIELLARLIGDKKEDEEVGDKRESYNIAFVPKLYNLNRNEILKNLDKIVHNNKELLDLMILIEHNNRMHDGLELRNRYNYVRNHDINASDFYKLVIKGTSTITIIDYLSVMISLLEVIKEKDLREKLRVHLLKVLVYKINDCSSTSFEHTLSKIRDKHKELRREGGYNWEKVWVSESLKLLKDSGNDSKVIDDSTYENGDIVVIDLKRKRKVFKSKESKKLREMLDKHNYLYYHEVDKNEVKVLELGFGR